MTYINITNDEPEELTMFEDDEELHSYPWILLNLDEIGTEIALQLFDADYDIKQQYIDEEINDRLSHIHEYLLERVIDRLEINGIMVY